MAKDNAPKVNETDTSKTTPSATPAAYEIVSINPENNSVVVTRGNETFKINYDVEDGKIELVIPAEAKGLTDKLVLESLKTFIEANSNPFVQTYISGQIAEANAKTTAAQASAGKWRTVSVFAGTGILVASAVAASAYLGAWDAEHKGFDAGKKAGFDAGHDATLAVVEHDLEGKILGGNWTHEKVNTTAKSLFNKTLDKMNVTELASVYAQLSFDSGRFSSPEATNATIAVLGYINSTWNVSKEQLKGLDLLGAVNLYAQLSVHDAEAALRTAAGNWNASWYQQGKDEILAKATEWNASQYLAGANSLRALANGWNASQYAQGKIDGAVSVRVQADGWNASAYNSGQSAAYATASGWNATNLAAGKQVTLDQLVGVVDDVLNATEIKGAHGDVAALLNLYAQKVKADALSLTDYTSDWVLAQTQAGNLNETELALGRLETLYGGFSVTHDNLTRAQSFMANLSQNDSNEMLRAGMNVSWLFNHGNELRFTDTFGAGGVVSAYSGDTVMRARISQPTIDRLKAWNATYTSNGGQ